MQIQQRCLDAESDIDFLSLDCTERLAVTLAGTPLLIFFNLVTYGHRFGQLNDGPVLDSCNERRPGSFGEVPCRLYPCSPVVES